MANNKPIEIEIEVKAKGIQELKNELKTLKEDLEKTSDPSTINKLTKQVEELTSQMEKTGKAVDNVEKNTKSLSNGFKAAGLALKAMGIGLAIEAFNILKDVFMSNQKVADAFSTGIKFLKTAFNDLFGYIEKNIGPVTEYFKGIFENPQKSLKAFGDAIKENLIERFNSFLDTLGYIASSVKSLLSGDLDGALDNIKKAGKESVDIWTGVNNTVDRTGKFISETADAIAEYTEKTWDAAAAQIALENSVKLAMARNAGLIEQYDVMAEKQRQIRDDETLSIEDRIVANDKLKDVLLEQAKVMNANALLAVQSAQNTVNENASIENQVALIEAQNEVKAIQAQITGFLSEQKVNEIALNKELNELNNLAIEGDTKRTISSNKFTTSLIKDTTDRLDAEKAALQEEYNIELKRLEDKKALYKEGTLAYAEAQQEILDLKATNDQALITNDKATQQALADENMARLTRVIGDESQSFNERYTALSEQLAQINTTEYASEEERTAAIAANTSARKALGEAEAQAKATQVAAIGQTLATASQLLGENTVAGKALAIAGTTVDTFQSSMSAYKGMVAAIPGPAGIAAGAVAAAASVATGLATVKKILAVKVPGKGASAGGGSVPTAPTTPTVNLFGGANRGNEATATRTVEANPQTQPIVVRAVISETEVTETQQRVQRIQQNAEL
jgi:hypothetical protein